jgi:DUF1680 family protein
VLARTVLPQTTENIQGANYAEMSKFDARFELSLKRVLSGKNPHYSPEFLLADVQASGGRRFTNFSGDLSGRYVGALASIAYRDGALEPELDSLVNRIIALQSVEGYFGTSFRFSDPGDEDLALLWGNGRLLIGLLEYLEFKSSPDAFASAMRLGDFFLRLGPLMNSDVMRDRFDAGHFATSYICWTQTIEGLVALYRATHSQPYLELAQQIATYTTLRPGEHAHGYLTSLRGIAELYKVTRDPELLASVESNWQQVFSSRNMLATGGVPERWIPQMRRTEGCAEADWIRLSLQLWSLTGNKAYLEAAERAIFNEFGVNQFDDGDFGHRVLNDTGIDATGAVRAWWCCTLHGLRCFPDICYFTFRLDGHTVCYDLPIAASFASDAFRIRADSTLASDATVRLRIVSATSTPVRLRIRQPSWAVGIEARLNNRLVMLQEEKGSFEIERSWAPGDSLELRYAMQLRAEPYESRMVLFYGPWLLGANESDNESYFNEISQQNILQLADARSISAEVGHTANNPFGVPIAHVAASYIPSEYPVQPGTVILRPVAEQTRLRTTGWQFVFEKSPHIT